MLAAEGSLQCAFPTSSAAVPLETFGNEQFQESLAIFLEQASSESIKKFAGQTQRAGFGMHECRDVSNPALITDMLITILTAVGAQHDTPILHKRIRDDCVWKDSLKPFRRSAWYLLLRVGIQRFLYFHHGPVCSRMYYKTIMLVALHSLLREHKTQLSSDSRFFVSAKLARRFSKFEEEASQMTGPALAFFEAVNTTLAPQISSTLWNVRQNLEDRWNDHKTRHIHRKPPELPSRANEASMRLELPHSQKHLDNVLTWKPSTDTQVKSFDPRISKLQDKLSTFVEHYAVIAQLEQDCESLPVTSVRSDTDHCVSIAANINRYMNCIKSLYDGDAEQHSIMILHILSLFVKMDEYACSAYKLLTEYHPGIEPRSLNILILPHAADMQKLSEIQQYLQKRIMACSSFGKVTTILADPGQGCFAERYFNEGPHAAILQELMATVRDKSKRDQDWKLTEWEEASARYNDLCNRFAFAVCDGTHGCHHCYLKRNKDKVYIEIVEDLLPSDDIEAKVVIFELACPAAFTSYRDVLWRIRFCLGGMRSTAGQKTPSITLPTYQALFPFWQNPWQPGGTNVCLASLPKATSQTHYHQLQLPVSKEGIYVPSPLKWRYYNAHYEQWTNNDISTDFSGLCYLRIGAASPFASYQKTFQDFAHGSLQTSNEILAKSNDCPSSLSPQENMIFGILLTCERRRWLRILKEIGSPWLNFSNETVSQLVCYLVELAGPKSSIRTADREVHLILKNQNFCNTLLDKIQSRFRSTGSNYRESTSMKVWVTILLRVCSLSTPEVRTRAMTLLEYARKTCVNWLRRLRCELPLAKDTGATVVHFQYVFWAALLCKKTYGVFANESLFPSRCLGQWIEASVALQDAISVDPKDLAPLAKRALIRDLKETIRLRKLVANSIRAYPDEVSHAIQNLLPGGGSRIHFGSVEVYEHDHNVSIRTTMTRSSDSRSQEVCIVMSSGVMLVDATPVGRLPPAWRKSEVLSKTLFPDQQLIVMPSGLPGMTYELTKPVHGHAVHFGSRNNELIIRTQHRDSVSEYIPVAVFGHENSFDLPASLLESCTHWLDVSQNSIEIRRNEWFKRTRSDWCVDLETRRATSGSNTLVCPHSLVFSRVTSVFRFFESPYRVIVFQPERASLIVELRRLDLTFTPNARRTLTCRELEAEVDFNQDAGVFYGLRSMLVLRSINDFRQRSIIVPLGSNITLNRTALHTSVTIKAGPDVSLGIFTVREDLGRLDCASTPKLIYFLAYLHAMTSHYLPDPLTGLTGTESAIHLLDSGIAQPWSPLSENELGILRQLSKLSPGRKYYPSNLKKMQFVTWNENVSALAQHDKLRTLCSKIMAKSYQLSIFATQPQRQTATDPDEEHLTRRGIVYRTKFERPASAFNNDYTSESDTTYTHCKMRLAQAGENVFETTTLLHTWSSKMEHDEKLTANLAAWSSFVGFNTPFNKVLISDQLGADLKDSWGPLVRFCQTSERKDIWRLVFLFGTISFRNDVDMRLIRSALAFAINPDLKVVAFPEHTRFMNFREDWSPSRDEILSKIEPLCKGWREHEHWNVSYEERQHLRKQHHQESDVEKEKLTVDIMQQWPVLNLCVADLSAYRYIRAEAAISSIQPEATNQYHNRQLVLVLRNIQQLLVADFTKHHIPQRQSLSEASPTMLMRPHCYILPTLREGLLVRDSSPILEDALARAKSISASSNNNALIAATSGDPLAVHQESGELSRSSPLEEIELLQCLLQEFSNTASIAGKSYAKDLLDSLTALMERGHPQAEHQDLPRFLDEDLIMAMIDQLKLAIEQLFMAISSALVSHHSPLHYLEAALLWPAMTTVTLLERLRSLSKPMIVGYRMTEAIVWYAVLIGDLQRTLRIQDANLKQEKERLHDELLNQGRNFDPIEYPDWVLIEIESNIRIRSEQVAVAIATASPSTDLSSVLQLSMGKGKSSVITPMAACLLASPESGNLLRVIVPRALLQQQGCLLASKMGRLLGRSILHVPFSRRTSNDQSTVEAYRDLHHNAQLSGGVVVALPEHIMSFRLSGLQRVADKQLHVARPLVEIEKWLHYHTRDIIDECDLSLAPRNQLIYPSGTQRTVDGGAPRWQSLQTVLHLVRTYLPGLRQNYASSIEVVMRPNGFPIVYFLKKDVQDELKRCIIADVLSGCVSTIPTRSYSVTQLADIEIFLSSTVPSDAVSERLRTTSREHPAAWHCLLLLRGLLVHDLLMSALRKRWNVDFGLHSDREPMAVPYTSRGIPSDTADWA